MRALIKAKQVHGDAHSGYVLILNGCRSAVEAAASFVGAHQPSVEYRLAPLGQSLLEPMANLIDFGPTVVIPISMPRAPALTTHPVMFRANPLPAVGSAASPREIGTRPD